MPRIELLVTPDCANAATTRARLEAAATRLTPGAVVEVVEISSAEEAVARGFPGSPTVRVDGRDLEGDDAPAASGLACRTYDGRGAPPEWMLEAALLRSLRPRHVLFLCVANSARSQMAEGIARSLAPSGVAISSAGSEPASVREEAVRALAEIGLDVRDQRSTGVDAVEGEPDAVITLCAEEVCPAWLGDVLRLRWPLPDPAAAGGTEEERMQAFRRVRDELRRRLGALFRGGRAPERSGSGATMSGEETDERAEPEERS